MTNEECRTALKRIAGYMCARKDIEALTHAMNVLEQEPINKPYVSSEVCEHDKQKVLDEIRAEITDCLKALDEIAKSELNIYLPNEISDRRLMYQQCLKFIDEYKEESDKA